MAARGTINRRNLLIGGGAGVGLVVAWALWPRAYQPNLVTAPGETLFGAWIKIGEDGHVSIAVPQTETGQGVYTALPQIVADELGADWRQIAVEPAPISPLYANPLGAEELFEGTFASLPNALTHTYAERRALMLTAGSSSIREFEPALRAAGAGARALLCQAAARRWGVDWRACTTANGFVVNGRNRARFGPLAAEATGFSLPDPLPMRAAEPGRLAGQPLPRLDVPAKVDGSANFAGDIRLPDMVFASIRQAPAGGRIRAPDRARARNIPGLIDLVVNEHWVAAAAASWWIAERALDAMGLVAEWHAGPSSAAIDAALDAALKGPGERMAFAGNLSAAFKGAHVFTADYRVGFAAHAAIETMTATARPTPRGIELWLPTLAPSRARAAVAAATGYGEGAILIHPTMAGGSFGATLEHEVAVQAATIALQLKRPVQLTWSRREDLAHDRFRPPAAARLTARLGPNGAILGWLAKIAAPATGREIAGRLFAGDHGAEAALFAHSSGDPYAVAGALPFYRFPNYAIDHHPVALGIPTGHWRSGAHSYTAFFTESFLDELAHAAETEPLSFRVALTGDPRLVRCLSLAATLGGWEGGVLGSGQGLACHSFRGSHIAVFAEAHFEDGGTPRVDRLVAAVDCGRQINPELVRQQVEGGLIFGLAGALGASTGFTRGVPDAHHLGALNLPMLADAPDITVELVPSEADPGGVSELAVPPVAPAIANALRAATGVRLRHLPLATLT